MMSLIQPNSLGSSESVDSPDPTNSKRLTLGKLKKSVTYENNQVNQENYEDL